MAVTLLQARTQVRELLDEASAQFWTDANLNDWLNEACADVARRLEWKRVIANIDVDAGTQTYTAPVDVYRIHRIEFVPDSSNNTYTVEFRGYMEMDQIWGINQQWPANYPLYYTLWKVPPIMSIILYPVPSQNGTLNVYYYQNITKAVADGDNIDCLVGWEDVTYDYAVYRALRKDADSRWQDFKATYEEKLISMEDSTRTFQDQAGTFTTGQAALPTWLVSDGLY